MFKQIMMLVAMLGCSTSVLSQQAVMKTNLGDIIIELKPQDAPESVANFKKYVDAAFYDGLVFHRVIAGFMIQGGGFDAQMQQKNAPYKVMNESVGGLSNKRATVAMARTNDPHSASSQFYINLVDNDSLDARGDNFGYTVFAEVIAGMQVVDKIAQQPTARKYGYANVPTQPMLIESIQWLQAKVEDVSTDLVVDITGNTEVQVGLVPFVTGEEVDIRTGNLKVRD